MGRHLENYAQRWAWVARGKELTDFAGGRGRDQQNFAAGCIAHYRGRQLHYAAARTEQFSIHLTLPLLNSARYSTSCKVSSNHYNPERLPSSNNQQKNPQHAQTRAAASRQTAPLKPICKPGFQNYCSPLHCWRRNAGSHLFLTSTSLSKHSKLCCFPFNQLPSMLEHGAS